MGAISRGLLEARNGPFRPVAAWFRRVGRAGLAPNTELATGPPSAYESTSSAKTRTTSSGALRASPV